MIRRLCAVFVALVLAALVTEIGFRVAGPVPYARPEIRGDDGRVVDLGEVIGFFRDGALEVPDQPRNGIRPNFRARLCYDRPAWPYFDADGCVEVSINSLGFRDEEFPLAKPPGELRVLAIGDSFTFAQGCRAEDGWTEVLEELLAEAEGRPVQVMNAGFTGGGSWPQEYAPWVLAHALAFEPDRVIYGFCLNDMDRRVPMLAYAKVWDNPIYDGEPWLGGHSEALNFFQRRRQQRLMIGNRPTDIDALIRADPGPWEANQAALRAIHAHLETHGVPLTVAVFPMLSMLGDGYPYDGLHARVADFCAAEGIDHLDLYAPFRDRRDRDLWVHPFDQHPAPPAQRLFAEGIFRHLTR